jgi:peptidoglycan/xylan/chitin deacetylase (PgdA/CDA1 family)
MRFISVPLISRIFYPSIIKSFPKEKGKLFFSFDDGPDPEVTPLILSILKQYQAKATFFCLGRNVEKYPEIFQSIIEQGHSVGNHSFNHLNGFKTKTSTYISDIDKAATLIKSDMFRPPYGKITPRQYFILKKKYKLIFWDIMTYDFDPSISVNECIEIVLKNVKNGSIIIFHDSQKAKTNVLKALPVLLEKLSQLNFSFEKIL